MGCFSYTCAKTGLAIAGEGVDAKFCTVVVLRPDGGMSSGEYDCYGSVGGFPVEPGPGRDKLVLGKFYRGERYAELGDSGSDPDQGSFDAEFMPAIFSALEADPTFPSKQYLQRLEEFTRLKLLANQSMDEAQDFSYANVWELRQAVDYNPGSDDDSVQKRQAAWQRVLQDQFGGSLPDGHPVAGMSMEAATHHLDGQRRHINRLIAGEVVAAWKAGRQARTPDTQALLAGDVGGWIEAPVSESKPDSEPKRKGARP